MKYKQKEVVVKVVNLIFNRTILCFRMGFGLIRCPLFFSCLGCQVGSKLKLRAPFRYMDFKTRYFTFLFNENNLLLDLLVDLGISRLSLGALLL